jgi:hypothetical protein
MKIIGRLFLSPAFQVLPAGVGDLNVNMAGGFILRVFSKKDDVDEPVLVFLDPGPDEKNRRFITDEIENYRVLTHFSGKRVFLQVQRFFQTEKEITREARVISVPFQFNPDNQVFSGILILTETNLKKILSILDYPLSGDMMDEAWLKGLEKFLFQRLSAPPEGMDRIILSLSDINLQYLLNRFLHKNIASIDMLAAYIRGLGEEGQRLLANLSRTVRKEVEEKVRNSRFSSTYRWSDEVNYIIQRNILISVREMELSIKSLSVLEFVRTSYETEVLKIQMQTKSLEAWLDEFSEKGLTGVVISGTARSVLVDSLTFCSSAAVERIFRSAISHDGVSMLLEDREYALRKPADGRMRSLIRFFRTIKDIYYSPLLEKMDFELEIEKRVVTSEAVDLIVDEIGFAQAVYAIKTMPQEWLNRVLKGVFKCIFEDVMKKKISIKNYGDYKIDTCRRNFLKAAVILGDEEKI